MATSDDGQVYPSRKYWRYLLAYELKMTVRELDAVMLESELNDWPTFLRVKREFEEMAQEG